MITLQEWQDKTKEAHNEFHYWFAPTGDCECWFRDVHDEDRYKCGRVYEGYSKNGGFMIDSCGEECLFDFYEDALFPARECYWDKAEAEAAANGNLLALKEEQKETMRLLFGGLI